MRWLYSAFSRVDVQQTPGSRTLGKAHGNGDGSWELPGEYLPTGGFDAASPRWVIEAGRSKQYRQQLGGLGGRADCGTVGLRDRGGRSRAEWSHRAALVLRRTVLIRRNVLLRVCKLHGRACNRPISEGGTGVRFTGDRDRVIPYTTTLRRRKMLSRIVQVQYIGKAPRSAPRGMRGATCASWLSCLFCTRCHTAHRFKPLAEAPPAGQGRLAPVAHH
jgi:hypothetical protein